jgi:hypothetical protein
VDINRLSKANALVKVTIQEQTSIGEYNDSLYYSSDDWEKLSEEDLRKAIEARVNNWITSVQSMSIYVPTKADLQREANEKEAHLNELKARIAEMH